MIKLHIPLWALLWRGAALSLAGLLMIRGHVFKRRLRRGLAPGERRDDGSA